MHRDHRFAQRAMPAAMGHELSARQRARFARHVHECPECGPMLRALIRLSVALRAIADAPADGPSVVPAVLERLHAERPDRAGAGTSRGADR